MFISLRQNRKCYPCVRSNCYQRPRPQPSPALSSKGGEGVCRIRLILWGSEGYLPLLLWRRGPGRGGLNSTVVPLAPGEISPNNSRIELLSGSREKSPSPGLDMFSGVRPSSGAAMSEIGNVLEAWGRVSPSEAAAP